VRLTGELRASRERIVAAQDAERRRIERDLHDGAQQHLVAMSINLRIAEELFESDPPAAQELLAEIRGQATDALATLRDLARGIYPSALADRGIGAALEGQLAKSRQGVSLDVQTELGDLRFSPAVEGAVYFCVVEALQNCSKHAPLAAVNVRLSAASNYLTFAVTDTGPGFEPVLTHGGTGLQGMADRLAAVGGILNVRSTPGHGTTIEGTLPIRGVVGANGSGPAVRRV
jgi:signal transduction histidine kinase